MSNSKNIGLAVVLVFLILLSIGLSFWDRGGNTAQVDPDLFAIENLDQVDRIVISGQDRVMDCRASPGGFTINNRYAMDPNMLTLLAAVLQRVKVQRPVAADRQPQVFQDIREQGSHVEVYRGDQLLDSFWAGGDASENISYFSNEEGDVYIVHLPGYNSYVSELFGLPISRWRSRAVFQNTWRSLLNYSYQDFSEPKNDFQISYQDPFFRDSGVQQMDSNRVMNYLDQVVSLQAASLVDTSYQGMPWAQIATTDIDPGKNQTLTLYGDLSGPAVLGKTNDQFMLFSSNSIEPIIRNSDYFKRGVE